MLRLFRQIRKRLLSDNAGGQDPQGGGNTPRYLLYVIGEIFIVIIGILLALQVDTWNNQREEREEAQVFLRRLKDEFLANRDQMLQKVTMREKALQSSRELLRFIDGNPKNFGGPEIDSLLAVALPVYTFDPSLGVLNQLTSTDKLTLIRSEALNNKLSIWDAMIEDFKEDERICTITSTTTSTGRSSIKITVEGTSLTPGSGIRSSLPFCSRLRIL